MLDPVTKPRRHAAEGKGKRRPKAEIDGKISTVVADARRLNSLTQEELAEAAGMTVYIYSRLENCTVAWLASQLIAVASALGLQSTDLLVAAGLSYMAGGLPEDAISRDQRLNPAQRQLALQYYRQFLGQEERPGGV